MSFLLSFGLSAPNCMRIRVRFCVRVGLMETLRMESRRKWFLAQLESLRMERRRKTFSLNWYHSEWKDSEWKDLEKLLA
jgi:hypothetical protein